MLFIEECGKTLRSHAHTSSELLPVLQVPTTVNKLFVEKMIQTLELYGSLSEYTVTMMATETS
jgi:hypothetical protein